MKSPRSAFLLLASSLLICSVSCDDFLDETPDNRVELSSLDNAAQLLTNGYSIASPAFTDWMTDDVEFTLGTNIRPVMASLYLWEDVTNADPGEQDSPEFFWYETYNAIAHANEVLAVLDELPVTTDDEEAQRDAIEGEAKLIRAYGHFMLVSVFAPAYTGSDSRDDLGIPYVKTPETEFLVTYTRQSVARVFEEIEDDLRDGLELVSDNYYANSGKYHFNTAAALAFASRFYLYKGDFLRCLEYSNELLGDSPEAYVRDLTGDEYQQAKASITGYGQLYSSPDQSANLLLMRKISLVQRTDYSYAMSQSTWNGLFIGANPLPGTEDERGNLALVKGVSRNLEQALFPLKYQSLFERSSLNSNVGTPYHIGIMFRGEEVLFNRVEANIYMNNTAAALADLNVLFARRYIGENTTATIESIREFYGFSSAVSDANVLLNFLFLEKRKEFLAQGMRWFDMKRYGLSMQHDLANGSLITLEGDDERYAVQIPLAAQQVGGLEPNPR